MPLTTDKFAVPDGAPVGGFQKMKSVTYGELSGDLVNPNYLIKPTAGNLGDVLTQSAAGVVNLQPPVPSRTVIITGDVVLTNDNKLLNKFEVDCTSGPVTVELPQISTVPNQRYLFIKTDSTSNKVTLVGNGAELINGNIDARVVSQYDTLDAVPDTTTWFISNEHANSKGLVVDRSGSGSQSIPSGVVTKIELPNVIVELPKNSYDPVTNFDWKPGNGIFVIDVGIALLALGNNKFAQLCIRKNGTLVSCQRVYSSTGAQDVLVKISFLDSNTDPFAQTYDITIEHDNGSNVNLSDNGVTTYWRVQRIV